MDGIQARADVSNWQGRGLALTAPGTGCVGAGPAGAARRDLFLLCRLAALAAVRDDACAAEDLLRGSSREAPRALLRQLAMYLAHVALGLTQSHVAQGFHRDRRTVAHACRRIEERRERPAFDAEVGRMEGALRWVAGR